MTSTPRRRLAVFDCDGTLVDSQHAIHAAASAAFARENLDPPSKAELIRVVGLPLAECIARLAPDASADRQTRLVEGYKSAFFELRQRPDHHEPLYPGVLEALAATEEAGFLLGIATGKARRGLMAVLERHDLQHRFVTLQTGDQGHGKPHPDMLLRAMAETGAAPADTVMIGDTSFDMMMATNAGVDAIGVTWGYHPAAELTTAGARLLIAAFSELPAALSRPEIRGRPSCA